MINTRRYTSTQKHTHTHTEGERDGESARNSASAHDVITRIDGLLGSRSPSRWGHTRARTTSRPGDGDRNNKTRWIWEEWMEIGRRRRDVDWCSGRSGASAYRGPSTENRVAADLRDSTTASTASWMELQADWSRCLLPSSNNLCTAHHRLLFRILFLFLLDDCRGVSLRRWSSAAKLSK